MQRAKAPGTFGALTVLLLVLLSVVFVFGVVAPRVHGQSTTVTGVGPWTQQNNYGSPSTSPGSGGIGVLGVSCVAFSGDAYCVGGFPHRAFLQSLNLNYDSES